ncbi:MAG: glycosyltransferase family 4 protein [Chloroflexota bacterium]
MAPNKAHRIAFFKAGSFSHINHQIEEILRTEFPEYPVDVFEIERLVRPHQRILLTNLFFLISDYQHRLSTTKGVLRKQFYRTTYLFRQIKALAQKVLKAKPYIFSFQTQSLFDASTPDIPHFIYTDHSILANLAYPGFAYSSIDALYPPALLTLEREIYQNAERVFTMGKFVAENLMGQYDCQPEQIICVGGGSNTYVDAPSTTRDYTKKNILFVGVNWERKGGPDLAQAYMQIHKAHPDSTLTIVGCQPDMILPNCHVAGPVAPANVQSYFDNASIFCLPSKREPFGVALIEASLARLPVVSTTIGAIPDIILHGASGMLVSPGDISGLEDALDRLLCSPTLCQQMGMIGHAHIKENFTWDIVGHTIANHIRRSIL